VNKLAEIFAHKREEVAASQARIPLAELKSMAQTPRGFREAIKTDSRPIALIAEVKKASPSHGMIREDFDPVEVAKAYEGAGATCLSVLTDSKFFQGSPENLMRVREAVPLPILRKDFTMSSYQLYEALAWGADCVLLIVAAFVGSNPIVSGGVTQLRELHKEARDIGLSVLVEVHDAGELDVALDLGADFIGVNNRNLMTFDTDLATSETLIPRIGTSAIAVAESAIRTHADVQRVASAGARAVLVGTTFCSSPDVAASVTEVMAW
jgi:indole-3-glycerol phosphate synthase